MKRNSRPVGRSRRSPSTPGRSPTRRRVPWCRRSRSRPRSPRARSGSTRATSTRARATPRAPRSRRRSPRSSGHATASRSRAGSPPRTTCCGSCGRASGSCSATTRTAARSDSSRRCGRRWGSRGPRSTSATSTRSQANWPDDTGMVWLETPTNPLLTCFDIEAVAEIAHAHGALVVVDNTFATPYLQQPITLGADIVVHSATKYLGGHSDVVGGFLAVDDDELAGRLRFTQNAAGAVPSPFDCYLVLRGAKTLGVRMDRHCENARAIVDLLIGPRRGGAGALPAAPRPPRPRRRGQADARLRRHGELHRPRWRGRGTADRGRDRAVHARRVARRGREPDRAPRRDDPRVGGRLTARGARQPASGSASASSTAATSSPTSPRPSNRPDGRHAGPRGSAARGSAACEGGDHGGERLGVADDVVADARALADRVRACRPAARPCRRGRTGCRAPADSSSSNRAASSAGGRHVVPDVHGLHERRALDQRRRARRPPRRATPARSATTSSSNPVDLHRAVGPVGEARELEDVGVLRRDADHPPAEPTDQDRHAVLHGPHAEVVESRRCGARPRGARRRCRAGRGRSARTRRSASPAGPVRRSSRPIAVVLVLGVAGAPTQHEAPAAHTVDGRGRCVRAAPGDGTRC